MNREMVIQYLYSQDLNPLEKDTKTSIEESFQAIACANLMDYEPEDLLYAQDVLRAFNENKPVIDDMITEHLSESSSINEVPAIDRNILRVLLCEMLYHNIPPAVAVNEAVEISKKFCSEYAGKFLHGVLDNIIKKNNIKGQKLYENRQKQ